MFHSFFKIFPLATLVFFVIPVVITFSLSDDADPKVRKRLQRILVVDPAGNPVPNATFTPSARRLASKTNVKLLHHPEISSPDC